MRYHIYWQDKILLKDLDEEEFNSKLAQLNTIVDKTVLFPKEYLGAILTLLNEEEFKNIWEKMHWVYNKELNYVEVGEHILEEASY